jgi:SAM-dependent methyltransferase
MASAVSANEEAIGAWNGVLFDRFVQYRHIVTAGLGAHGEEALRGDPPRLGERVLDIGCGFGDTTQRLAGLVGREGAVLGVDAAERFVAAAHEEAEHAGVTNARFLVGDVQTMTFAERFDYAFSRFGTMFFANPVVALRNVRAALEPGGRLCMVVWRSKGENPWMARAEEIVEQFVTEDEESDELTCGPGPFSMGNADTTSEVVLHAGFVNVALRRCDIPVVVGRDLDEAVQFLCALGPAGEVIRLAGAEAVRLRPRIEAALADALREYVTDDGSVRAGASTWIVTAQVPAPPGSRPAASSTDRSTVRRQPGAAAT